MPKEVKSIRELTKAIAKVFGLTFIASSSGSLEPEEEPFPWISFFPACLREKSGKFLLFLAVLGEWNRKHPDAQWVYRPKQAKDQTQFTVYCLLEPLERNEGRDLLVLNRLHSETLQLADFLLQTVVVNVGSEQWQLEWCYPRPSSGVDSDDYCSEGVAEIDDDIDPTMD